MKSGPEAVSWGRGKGWVDVFNLVISLVILDTRIKEPKNPWQRITNSRYHGTPWWRSCERLKAFAVVHGHRGDPEVGQSRQPTDACRESKR